MSESSPDAAEAALPPATGSAFELPTKCGFYWWREDATKDWRLVEVMDFGSGRFMTYDLDECEWSGRSLEIWREGFPIGEWRYIVPPNAHLRDAAPTQPQTPSTHE
jgi:hypothetical protein